jgi:octanoyl-[GcvH]:protein N-octanoyltransferase
VLLIRDSFPEDPVRELAVSHALLVQVARGEHPPAVRLYRPGATVAFGRVDMRRPGFADAVRAARAHRVQPVVRVSGGNVAAYHDGALVYEEITRTAALAGGLQERFQNGAGLLARALGQLGLDARIGELAGEYCPGAYSVNLGGRIKVAGTAQRVVRGGALFGAVVLVAGGARTRAVLVDVYAALRIEWRPETAGAIDDVDRAIGPAVVEEAIVRARGGARDLEVAALAPATLELAATLEPRHSLSG